MRSQDETVPQPNYDDIECKTCHQTGFIFFDSTFGGQICEECGNCQTENEVVHQVQLTSQGTVVGQVVGKHTNGAAPYSAEAPSINQNHTQARTWCYRTLSLICTALHLPTTINDQSEQLMNAYMRGTYCTGQYAKMVIGSCIYATCRLNEKALTLYDIAKAIDTPSFKLGRVFNRLVDEMQLKFKTVTPFIYVERVANILLEDIAIPEKNEIQKKAEDLLKLADREWLLPGRFPSPFAVAALMIAYKALGHPKGIWESKCEKKQTVKMIVEKLADNLHVNSNTIFTRERELKHCLLKLSQQLPWASEINEKTIDVHIPFLINNLDMLMLLRMGEGKKKVFSRVVSQSQESDRTTSSLIQKEIKVFENTSNPPSFNRGISKKSDRLVKLKKAAKRIEAKSLGKCQVDLSEIGVTTLEDVDLVDDEPSFDDLDMEKQLLQKVSPHRLLSGYHTVQVGKIVLDSEQVEGEEEISESEIDSYIRRDSEAKRKKKTGKIKERAERRAKRRFEQQESELSLGRKRKRELMNE